MPHPDLDTGRLRRDGIHQDGTGASYARAVSVAGIVEIVSGAVLVAAAGVAAAMRVHRRRSAVQAALRSTDPDVRAEGVRLAATVALRRFTPELVALAQAEADPTVRQALAGVAAEVGRQSPTNPLVQLLTAPPPAPDGATGDPAPQLVPLNGVITTQLRPVAVPPPSSAPSDVSGSVGSVNGGRGYGASRSDDASEATVLEPHPEPAVASVGSFHLQGASVNGSTHRNGNHDRNSEQQEVPALVGVASSHAVDGPGAPAVTTPAGETPSSANPPAESGDDSAGADRSNDVTEPTVASTPPALASADAPTAVEGEPAVVRPQSQTGPRTVVVLGASGPDAVAVISTLVASGHLVVATSDDAEASGLRLAHEAHLVPEPTTPGFTDAVMALVGTCSADAVVSTSLAHAVAIAGGGGRPHVRPSWQPPSEAISLCADRWALHERLGDEGIAAVPCTLTNHRDLVGPWEVVSRFRLEADQRQTADDAFALAGALHLVREPMVRQRIDGRRFAAEVVVDPDGYVAGVVPRNVREVGGDWVSETVADTTIASFAATVAFRLELLGLTTVHGVIDHDGRPWLVDIDPYPTAGIAVAQAAGADLLGEYLRGIAGLPVRPDRLSYRDGVRVFSYTTVAVEPVTRTLR